MLSRGEWVNDKYHSARGHSCPQPNWGADILAGTQTGARTFLSAEADLNEIPYPDFGHGSLKSFKKADHSAFHVNGNYVGTQLTGPTTLNYDGHPGYDHPVPIGTDVFAAADAEVAAANSSNPAGSGNYVRIQHGNSGYQSQYLHLSQV